MAISMVSFISSFLVEDAVETVSALPTILAMLYVVQLLAGILFPITDIWDLGLEPDWAGQMSKRSVSQKLAVPVGSVDPDHPAYGTSIMSIG